MEKSFYAQSTVFKTVVLELLANFNLSSLYSKNAYVGDYQKVVLQGQNITLEIFQERLYKKTKSYKTNTVGEVYIKMYDKFENESNYTYNEFLKIVNWDFDDKGFRLIIPSILLPQIKQFVKIAIENNLSTSSTETEQIIYYVEDKGEISYLCNAYPQIINETKPTI